LDAYFLEDRSNLAENAGEVIDSEALLSSVIGRISEENQKAQKARADGQDMTQDQSAAQETANLLSGLI
jgi:hypothetical protein